MWLVSGEKSPHIVLLALICSVLILFQPGCRQGTVRWTDLVLRDPVTLSLSFRGRLEQPASLRVRLQGHRTEKTRVVTIDPDAVRSSFLGDSQVALHLPFPVVEQATVEMPDGTVFQLDGRTIIDHGAQVADILASAPMDELLASVDDFVSRSLTKGPMSVVELRRNLGELLHQQGVDRHATGRLRRILVPLAASARDGRTLVDVDLARRFVPLRMVESLLAGLPFLTAPWGEVERAVGTSFAPLWDITVPLEGWRTLQYTELFTQVPFEGDSRFMIERWSLLATPASLSSSGGIDVPDSSTGALSQLDVALNRTSGGVPGRWSEVVFDLVLTSRDPHGMLLLETASWSCMVFLGMAADLPVVDHREGDPIVVSIPAPRGETLSIPGRLVLSLGSLPHRQEAAPVQLRALRVRVPAAEGVR